MFFGLTREAIINVLIGLAGLGIAGAGLWYQRRDKPANEQGLTPVFVRPAYGNPYRSKTPPAAPPSGSVSPPNTNLPSIDPTQPMGDVAWWSGPTNLKVNRT